MTMLSRGCGSWFGNTGGIAAWQGQNTEGYEQTDS